MSKRFTNWMGNVKDSPKDYLTPNSIEEVANIVRSARKQGRKIRVVGSGHSWSRLVPNGDILISLDRMSGILQVDENARTAVVQAGTKIWKLANLLHAQGWAMENFGDINRQSLAGAISTGTHGSGLTLGSLSTQVVGLTLVTAKGDVLECSAKQHPEIFKAAQVSLGLLGIIVTVKLKIIPAQRLHVVRQKDHLDNTLKNLEAHLKNRHFEFYWFPCTKHTYLKIQNFTEDPLKDGGWKYKMETLFIENYLLWLVCNLVKWFPSLAIKVSRFSGNAVRNGEFVNYNHLMLSTPRLVTFTDMEYAIPISDFKAVIQEMEVVIQQEELKEHFPIVCRFVRGDDIYLSGAHGKDVAYISLHNYGRRRYPQYFDALERIFIKYRGRPHWGKFHSMQAPALKPLYPAWDAFMAIRRQLDPSGLFMNDYLQELLNITDAPNNHKAETTVLSETNVKQLD